MGKNKNEWKKYAKILMILPLVFLTFCQNIDNDVVYIDQEMITKNDDVAKLMHKIAFSNFNYVTSKKTTSPTSCTGFQYPMTIYSYIGDDPDLKSIIIKNDQELLDFFNRLTNTNTFYIDFPLKLIDTDEVETIIYSIEELRGTLQTAIDICEANDANSSVDTSVNDNSSNPSSSTSTANNEYQYCHKNNKKVYICHNGQTICVSVNAIWGHLNHHPNDKLGQCD